MTIDLIPPGTLYGDTVNQLDWRMSKSVSFPKSRRLALNLDLYNVLNGNQNLKYNNNYGSQWLYSQLIIGGRLIKFSGQFDF
jgi:hypothetical protein